MRMLYFTLLLLCSAPSIVANDIGLPENVVPDADEYQALRDLYTNTNGSSWTNKTNWPATWPSSASSAEFATWFGVTVVNGDVTALALPSNNLSGTLPLSIGQLTRLQMIYLSGNHITGNIPSEIGSLVLLNNLFLDYNQLTGEIPGTINGLIAISEIWLNNNQLTGSLPASLASMSSLSVLNFSNNQLSGALPNGFGGLNNLNTFGYQVIIFRAIYLICQHWLISILSI